jgi:hypothetical protein
MTMPQKYCLLVALLCALALAPTALPQVSPEAFNGRPEFSEESDFGYYVWRDGDTWHVRWMTMGNFKRFHGSVTAEGGNLSSLKRVDVETESRIIRCGRAPSDGAAGLRWWSPVNKDSIEKDGDNRIIFSARTDDVDGFDFRPGDKVSGLRSVLETEGKSYPRNVEIGKNNQRAPRLPLLVRFD